MDTIFKKFRKPQIFSFKLIFLAASTLPRATPTQQPRPEGTGGREKGAPTDNYATVRRGTDSKVRHKVRKHNFFFFKKLSMCKHYLLTKNVVGK